MRITSISQGDKGLLIFDILLILFTTSALLLSIFVTDIRLTDTLMILSVLGLLPVAISAIRSLIKREISVDLLASIALIFSIISTEWFSAGFITLMLAFARIFDLVTMAKTKSIIQSLMKYHVESVRLMVGETIRDVHIKEVKSGDLVIVDAGDKMPVDGVVISGNASVDESSLTGESELVSKKEGDKVFTSTINQSGSLIVRATKIGADTTLSKIIALVEEASRKKSKAERLAGTFTKWYIVSVLFVSIALYLFGVAPQFILSILLVVCADDVAVAVPLSFTAAISGLAKRGVIVKGSSALEQVSRLKYILTDKTGTLTKGKPKVVGIRSFGDIDESKVAEYFGMGAVMSNHAVSKAIINYLRENKLKIHNPHTSEEISGQGISFSHEKDQLFLGRLSFMEKEKIAINEKIKEAVTQEKDAGRGTALLALNSKIIGLMSYIDELRPRMKEIIDETKILGVKEWHMLTGDNEKVAKVVSGELGLSNPHANMTPESKVDFVRKFQNQKRHGEIVAYIGDGVNDAASLALADVSIAMGGIGSDVAIEAADITIMHDHLNRLPQIIRTGKNVRRIMYQCFGTWTVTNIVGLALVLTGVIGPVGAAAYNFLTDFVPILNALRASKIK